MPRPVPEMARLTYTVPQAAQALNVSQPMVWALIRSGELPTMHIGARVLIGRERLERWVTANSDSAVLPDGLATEAS